MANDLKSFSELFQKRIFRIPDYQRGYAWQQSQLVDFWDDLINLQSDRFHYTGMLSLKKYSQEEIPLLDTDVWVLEKGYKAYHIVDGQQRLTTFVILINEIVEFCKSISDKNETSV